MDIVVFGAGSLGSLVGGVLAREHDVTLVGRDPHVSRVREAGLRVTGALDAHTYPDAVTDWPPSPGERGGRDAERNDGVDAGSDVDGAGPDLALVTVKTYDTADAAAALRDGDPTVVCSLQNGLTEAVLAEALGDRVLAGTASYGAELAEPGRVECTGVGRIHVGELDGGGSDRAERVASAFRDAGLRCAADPEMPRRRWEKLAVNAGINAVTALARVRNGAVTDAPGREPAVRAARETARVARAEGVPLSDGDAVDALDAVADDTAANRSSMLQDVDAGRRTEVDAINGAVVDRAAGHDVAAATNRTLVDILRTWESARGFR
ncbi:ketopantoate reductase family protein [Halobaculum sp. D14]|uniref:ketopantoate reductase family protein n=1 Tax=Halobaculum sp. D14 TaxID=3421642 RepID=UPI003EBC8E06